MTLGDMLKNGVAKSSRNLFPVTDNEQNFMGIILLDDIRTVMFDQYFTTLTTVETFMKSPSRIHIYEKDSYAKGDAKV